MYWLYILYTVVLRMYINIDGLGTTSPMSCSFSLFAIANMFWLWTFILTSLVIPSVLAADHPWQTQFHAVGEDWHKYVRAPPREIVRPARVLGSYTYGDVINPDGLITGTASTILTRIPKDATAAGASDVTPSIVVDWGQNMAGIVSIEFGGSLNTTTGRPGIRLAFSETLQFLSNVSDFSRSDNVNKRMPLHPSTVLTQAGRNHR